jgi:hypothetical protein
VSDRQTSAEIRLDSLGAGAGAVAHANAFERSFGDGLRTAAVPAPAVLTTVIGLPATTPWPTTVIAGAAVADALDTSTAAHAPTGGAAAAPALLRGVRRRRAVLDHAFRSSCGVRTNPAER